MGAPWFCRRCLRRVREIAYRYAKSLIAYRYAKSLIAT
jgi:hypothetical protein